MVRDRPVGSVREEGDAQQEEERGHEGVREVHAVEARLEG